MRHFMRSMSIALLVLGISHNAIAQDAKPSPPSRGWNIDLAGTAGVRPGIGDVTTGLDLSGTVTVVRTTKSDEFRHRCLGLTAMFSGLPGERSVLFGPRWDAGDEDGTGFFRILAGVRKLSGPLPDSNEPSETTFGVGAGVGLSVIGILFDVNWIMSPWAERPANRLSVSVGYTWSFPLK